MVGKLAFGKLQQRLNKVISHESDDSVPFTRPPTNEYKPVRQHVPFIASPLDPKVSEWLKTKHLQGNLTLKRRPTVAQQEAHRVSDGIFRKQHEASPLELFFDLFFVANLAVFTYNNPQADGQGVGNYVGFFAIIWTFWFHISIYDVRFYVDSILNRFFKLTQFIMFTSFTGLGVVYKVLANGGTTRVFHGLALVLMLNRLILLVQYAVVLWSVRAFKKTMVPLALMMVIYLCAAMAFLGTYLYDPSGRHVATSDNVQLVTVWYCIIAVEAIAVVVVSSIWRVLSFKRTHLVERAGLLTLIVMGEGIIGICKSIATVLDGTTLSIWDAAGRVIAGVFLIYVIFVLYFTPIAHDRFGTIRQQVWVLLHLPLHVAIVLTEEGSAALLLWTAVMNAVGKLENSLPPFVNPATKYPNIDAFVAGVNETITNTSLTYTYIKLKDMYDWYPDLYRLKNISAPYGSDSWNNQSSYILQSMANKTTSFFFSNFKFEAPYEIKYVSDTNTKLEMYESSAMTIFTFFYISSGFLLLTLAAMFWIGKNNKTWEEYVSIGSRIMAGIALPLITIACWTQKNPDTAFMYQESGWIVSVVLFCYLFVLTVDNIVANIYDKRYVKKASSGEIDAAQLEDLHKRRYNGAFGPHEPSPHQSSTDIPTLGKTTSPTRKGIRFEERSTVGSNLNQVQRSDSSESNGLTSDDVTLSGQRDSEQIQKSETYLHPSPPQQQTQRTERNWQQQPTYFLPPLNLSRDNSGYGRIDTQYRGYEDTHLDAERGEEFRNDRSFEEERMMSPATWTDSHIEPPQEGHHRQRPGQAM